MPFHRFPSGPDEDNWDVLEAAVKKLEAKGEEVVWIPPFPVEYPVGEWVIVTRKTTGRGTSRVEKRAA